MPRRAFLPDFCAIPMVFGLVLAGEMLALLLVLGAGWPGGGFWERFSLVSLYIQWIGLTTTALACLLRPWLWRLPDRWAGMALWVLLLTVTAAVAEGVAVFGGFALAAGERLTFMGRSLGVAALVGAAALRYSYLYGQWQRQMRARAEARYQALAARIRPHFLFNSLNTAASLAISDPVRAEALILDLADLFRAALGGASGHSTLGRELELGRLYLGVEKLRLGKRLEVAWDLDPELPLDAPMPLLSLQPLLENAVYHGIEPSPGRGSIQVVGRYRRDLVNLSVRNPFPRGKGGHREGNRMALDNVAQRLAALYGDHARLVQGRVEGDFQVRLAFPWPCRTTQEGAP